MDPATADYRGNTPGEIQTAGFDVIPYTVDTEADMSRMLDLGVDGMYTDFPDVLICLIESRSDVVQLK